MLGLRKRGGFGDHKDDIIQDPLRIVFRSPRCFLDDNGDPVISQPPDRMSEVSRSDYEQNYIEECRKVLVDEYRRYIGSINPTSQLLFCELIATSVARRIQVACGLTTRLFRSYDDDEIILTMKTDDMDLRVEADRRNYRLQTRNKPFDPIHAESNVAIKESIGEEAFAESIEHLREVRGEAHVGMPPEMDPLLSCHGETHHPKLWKALKLWGHREEADGNFVDCQEKNPANVWTRLMNALVYIAWDPQIYFSPYASYQIESKYQPYYRMYPLRMNGLKEETRFRQVDRIVLASSIIERHIGIDALIESKYLNDHFALHEQEALTDLRKNWALNFNMISQPIMKLRNYFGEKIALYFAWLEFYAKMLVWPAVIGLLLFIVDVIRHKRSTDADEDGKKDVNDGYYLVFFSVFVVIWSTLFTELWKRKNSIYNTLWGSVAHDASAAHERPQFVGEIRHDPITDMKQVWYQSVTERRRKITVSLLVVATMILIVIVALGGLFYLKFYVDREEISNGPHIVSVLNAIQIMILNLIYRGVAIRLNDWENHRTDVEYENYLVTKVFLFQFVNSFASFFYIAFLKTTVEGECVNKDCMRELENQLAILFIIRIVVGNIMEVAVPFFTYRFRLWSETKDTHQGNKPQYEQAEKEAKLNPYEDMESFEDYNEMVIQYGFVTLFVVAFPLTPLLALINNYLEVHVDAFKLCVGHRRPFPRRTKSIGSWFYFLRVMSNIAMITNCALILFTSDMFGTAGEISEEKLMVFILAEHVGLGLKMFVESVVRDVPMQLGHLNDRYKHIEAMVFKGLFTEADESLCERAEKVNVLIESNPNWDKDK